MTAARKLSFPRDAAEGPLVRLYRGYLAETGSEVAAAIFALAEHQRAGGEPGSGTQPPGRTVLSPPQVATQLGVDPATVIGWIRSGQLKASNVGKGGRRPRYRVQQNDLDAFMRKRQPVEKPAARQLRRKHQDDVIEFF
jgi:hypothetical protein